jgi:hypothetical protein
LKYYSLCKKKDYIERKNSGKIRRINESYLVKRIEIENQNKFVLSIEQRKEKEG